MRAGCGREIERIKCCNARTLGLCERIGAGAVAFESERCTNAERTVLRKLLAMLG